MCDQQRLRSACAYAQSDQSLCYSHEYSMIVKLFVVSQLKKETAETRVYTCKKATLLEITCHGSSM